MRQLLSNIAAIYTSVFKLHHSWSCFVTADFFKGSMEPAAMEPAAIEPATLESAAMKPAAMVYRY